MLEELWPQMQGSQGQPGGWQAPVYNPGMQQMHAPAGFPAWPVQSYAFPGGQQW